MKISKLIKALSVIIVIYALGLKFVPEYMPFASSDNNSDFYEPHSSCFQDPEF